MQRRGHEVRRWRRCWKSCLKHSYLTWSRIALLYTYQARNGNAKPQGLPSASRPIYGVLTALAPSRAKPMAEAWPPEKASLIFVNRTLIKDWVTHVRECPGYITEGIDRRTGNEARPRAGWVSWGGSSKPLSHQLEVWWALWAGFGAGHRLPKCFQPFSTLVSFKDRHANKSFVLISSDVNPCPRERLSTW